jgi:hypothetical protein
MAKDPAFLFYSQDFYTGVAELNFEDRGKFITILCIMHQKGRMKEETIRFLVGSVSDMLRLKFKVDSDGFWYNERLETEAEKRNKFVDSRKHNGSKGGRPATKKPLAKPKVKPKKNHTEDENEDVNSDLGKGLGENLKERFEILRSNRIWIEQVCIAHKITEDKFNKMLSAFEAKCITANEDQSITELMRYFGNWIPLNLDRFLNNGKTTRENNNNSLTELENELSR